MKTTNYGYLYTYSTTFIIADGIILILKGADTFFWYLLIFQGLFILIILLFSFKIVEYSKEGILIKIPFRGYSKWIDKENVDYFFFRYIQGARYSGIDLFIQQKITDGRHSFFKKLKLKITLKHYFPKKEVISFSEWLKENGYNVRFFGDFDTINLKK